jgi:hypothetical protein
VVAIVGVIGTLPTSFIYGTVGADLADAALHRTMEGTLWPGFYRFERAAFGTISLLSMMMVALVIWGLIGAMIGSIVKGAHSAWKLRDSK